LNVGQVVWVNYQIMTTVAWNVQIKWPAPFATFERLLSILDLSLLRLMPVACIVPCEFLPIEPKFMRSNANTLLTMFLSLFVAEQLISSPTFTSSWSHLSSWRH